MAEQSATTDRISAATMSAVLSRAMASGLFAPPHTAAVFYDLERFERGLAELRAAFPPSALHTVAVKANPLVAVLRRARAAGHGAEVASMGELRIALAAGFPPDDIVFDSPVKTREELSEALQLGVRINANCLEEIDRIATLYDPLATSSLIGVRINPELEKGAIESTSVAVAGSKFGAPLGSRRDAIVAAFRSHPWLTGLHVHIGSQGMSLEQLVEGVGAVHDLADELDRIRPLSFFNIGGGLAAQYRADDPPPDFSLYAEKLRARCPLLFRDGPRIITEFGRALHAACGWAAARVEYVTHRDMPIATILTHLGADMFPRKAYRPTDWHHDVSLCTPCGALSSGPSRRFQIAGPLCFAGDFINRNVSLPTTAAEGDILLLHDVGAYTFSMWSLYNSRQFPAAFGYRENGTLFEVLRTRETENDLLSRWLQ